MTISAEQLAAYADGELDEVTTARVLRAVEDDPALAGELAKLSELWAMLAARFDPVLAEPVPERLSRPIADAAKVVSLDAVRAARQSLWQRPQFRLGAGAAIAASLVVTLLIAGHDEAPQGYADTQLAAALDDTLSGQTAPSGTRLLVSFRDRKGAACRAYSSQTATGIACHDETGWKVEASGPAGSKQTTQYKQAGSADATIMAAVQDMAVGPAFDTVAEEFNRKTGWQAEK